MEERAQREADTRRTSIANQMRAASASPQLKFGGPESDVSGTGGFRRRKDLLSSVAQGIASRMVSIGGINL